MSNHPFVSTPNGPHCSSCNQLRSDGIHRIETQNSAPCAVCGRQVRLDAAMRTAQGPTHQSCPKAAAGV